MSSHLSTKFWHLGTIFLIISISLGSYANQTKLQNSLNGYIQPKTYYKYDEVKCDSPGENSCYFKTYCRIYQISFSSFGSNNSRRRLESCEKIKNDSSPGMRASFDNFTGYDLNKNHTETTIVYIHGLWGSPKQFLKIVDRIRMNMNDAVNMIKLTLPGHGFGQSHKAVELEKLRNTKLFSKNINWITAVHETLKIANDLSENVIIVGQSTGGLLATIAAKKWPNLVDSIVLIEPALRVQPLMDFGACLSKSIPDSMVNFLASIIGLHLPDSISVEMGCEVQKLADQFIKRRDFVVGYGGKNDQIEIKKEDYIVYEDFAKKINKPVLLFNNIKDKIVSPRANINFFKGLNVFKEYVPFNSYGKSPHGVLTYKDSTFIVDSITKFFFKLGYENLSKIYLYTLEFRISKLFDVFCSTRSDPVGCEKETKYNKIKAPLVIEEVCLILKDGVKCEKFRDAINRIIEFYDKAISYAIIEGVDINDFFEEYRSLIDYNSQFKKNSEDEKFIVSIQSEIRNIWDHKK
jgi:pimeloyl-ACP methyl ester carboxylesterase